MSAARALWLLAPLLAACAVQVPPRFAAADLPRAYSGRFVWADRSGECGYAVTLALDAATPGADGRIILRGTTSYQPGEHQMTITGTIDPATLRVTLRESAPSHADAVVDGVFEGAFSPDLRSVAAIWTTTGTGAQGVLVLSAEPVASEP